MESQKTCCAAAAARMTKELALPSGEVGIVNLESILKAVADLKLADDNAIRKELLNRIKIFDYVAPCSDNEYSEASLEEYRRQHRIVQREGKYAKS